MMIDMRILALTKKLHAAQEYLIFALINSHRGDDARERVYVRMAGERLDAATRTIRQLLDLLDTAADASSEDETEHGGVL